MERKKALYKLNYDQDFPLRGKIAPLHDEYKFKDKRNTTVEIPGWAVGVETNHPIPIQKNDLFDFTHSIYGPPDMPVRAGIVGRNKTVKVENNKVNMKRTWDSEEKEYSYNNGGFYSGEQKMLEFFVDTPFVLESDLPCSVLGFQF